MNIEKKYIFFLGGYDAEMLEIKSILIQKNLLYKDKNLSWGAKASDYIDEITNLKETEIPVLIELTIDIPLPSNAIIVDHHNERESDKSSIEQIAEILNIQLNRWQQLISANDKGYIDAMKELNASAKEIEEVRKYDRHSQGVTNEDEKKAEDSIRNNLTHLNYNTVFIHSLTERTSPIVDALNNKYKNIFIVTPGNELNFFGDGRIVELLINYYSNETEKGNKIKYWSGGALPEKGFFGAEKNLFKTVKEIKKIL